MARKNDGLIVFLTELPWWVSVIVAGVVYVGMRWILPSMEFSNPMLRSLAAATPNVAWIFGLLFLFPALISFFKGKQRQHLLDSRSDIDSIRDLSWADFERLIGEAFRRRGYSVEERGGGGADGGVDLVLHKGGEKILVQCKQWKSRRVGVNVVRELYGVMVHEKAARAIVAISGEFTQEAKGFARGKPLELLNGPALCRLVTQVQPGAVTQRAEPVLATTERDNYPGIRSVGGRGQFDDYAIMQARPQSSTKFYPFARTKRKARIFPPMEFFFGRIFINFSMMVT